MYTLRIPEYRIYAYTVLRSNAKHPTNGPVGQDQQKISPYRRIQSCGHGTTFYFISADEFCPRTPDNGFSILPEATNAAMKPHQYIEIG
jgi:hypothetical protein